MCNRRTSSSILISVFLTIVKAQLQTTGTIPTSSGAAFASLIKSAGSACSIVNIIRAEECPAGAAQCDAVHELLSWAAAHGAQCDRLQTDTTLAIRGLTATTDIPGGSVIVSLPRSLALSVSPSQSCPVPHLIPEDVWSSSIKYNPLVILHLSRLG